MVTAIAVLIIAMAILAIETSWARESSTHTNRLAIRGATEPMR